MLKLSGAFSNKYLRFKQGAFCSLFLYSDSDIADKKMNGYKKPKKVLTSEFTFGILKP